MSKAYKLNYDINVRLRIHIMFNNWSLRRRENTGGSLAHGWLWSSLTALLTVFFLTVCASYGHAGEISISQSLDRFSIQFHDSVYFDIVLKWEGSQSAYLFSKPLNPSFHRLKVRGYTSSISSTGFGDNEVTTKRFRYTLIPTSAGTAQIDPVAVSFISWPDSVPGELFTEAMTVQIAEPPPPAEEGSDKTVLIVIVTFVVVGFLAFALVKWVRSKQPKEVQKSPIEQFLEKLTEIKQEAGGDFKKFQIGLYENLAVFLETMYHIEPDKLADNEIDSALKATDLSDSQRVQIARWLTQARQDKFRPVASKPGETMRLETEIRQFFEKL